MQEDERDLLEVLIFDEIEETVGTWLRAIIQHLEKEQTAIRRDQHKQPPEAAKRSEERPSTGSTIGRVQSRRVRLRWTGGGKFFRFRAHPVLANGSNSTVDAPRGIRRARHYWFCERCSHVFALVYEKEYGVMLKLL